MVNYKRLIILFSSLSFHLSHASRVTRIFLFYSFLYKIIFLSTLHALKFTLIFFIHFFFDLFLPRFPSTFFHTYFLHYLVIISDYSFLAIAFCTFLFHYQLSLSTVLLLLLFETFSVMVCIVLVTFFLRYLFLHPYTN